VATAAPLVGANRARATRAMDAARAKRRERAHKLRARDHEARDGARDATRGRRVREFAMRLGFRDDARGRGRDERIEARDGASARLTRAKDSRARAERRALEEAGCDFGSIAALAADALGDVRRGGAVETDPTPADGGG